MWVVYYCWGVKFKDCVGVGGDGGMVAFWVSWVGSEER